MRRDPLFLRFVNGQVEAEEIAESFLNSSRDPDTDDIINDLLDKREFPNLSHFRKDFGNVLKDLIQNGPIPPVRTYLTNYMEPSLNEYQSDSAQFSTGITDRWVGIKSPGAPWMEALVCYNLCMYLKGFGGKDLKSCAVCGTFFNHKGPHAKYCSITCKQSPDAELTRGG